MRRLMSGLVAAVALVGVTGSALAQVQGGGGAGGGQLIPKPTVLEMIWEDAFGAPFVDGFQFLILTEPDPQGTSEVWLIDVDQAADLGSATLAGDLLDAQFFPVEWYETLDMPFDCTVDGVPALANLTVVVDAVVGRLVTEQEYDRWITGLSLRVSLEMVSPSAGETVEFNCFLPLARHPDEAAASQYAWEYSLLEPEYPETLPEEDCWDTFLDERSKAWTDYFSEIDNCDGDNIFVGAVGGAVGGGTVGAIIGSVIPGVGTAAGGVAGVIIGAVGGGIAGYQLCVDGAKERYRSRYSRHWNCYQICVQNGDGQWPCALD